MDISIDMGDNSAKIRQNVNKKLTQNYNFTASVQQIVLIFLYFSCLEHKKNCKG